MSRNLLINLGNTKNNQASCLAVTTHVSFTVIRAHLHDCFSLRSYSLPTEISPEDITHGCYSQIFTVNHGYSRLVTVIYDYSRLGTVTYKYSRSVTVIQSQSLLFTVCHGYNLLFSVDKTSIIARHDTVFLNLYFLGWIHKCRRGSGIAMNDVSSIETRRHLQGCFFLF